MTKIRLTGLPLKKPGTSEEEIDRAIAMLSAFTDADLRCRALQEYVRFLLQPRKPLTRLGCGSLGCESKEEFEKEFRRLTRGRLADPNTRREQTLSDWDVFESVEDILLSGRANSVEGACHELAKDRGLCEPNKKGQQRGEAPESGLRKAYYRHTHTPFYPASSRLRGMAGVK